VEERTNGWINHCLGIDRHDEITVQANQGFLYLSQVARRRVDRCELFDTL
jgi:hypothetical protein